MVRGNRAAWRINRSQAPWPRPKADDHGKIRQMPRETNDRLTMKLVKSSVTALVLATALGIGTASAGDMINAEVWNYSDMNRWVQVTDLTCGTVLYKDKMDAQAKLPVELCTDDAGVAKVQLYIRIGCTKNKTIVKEGVADGARIAF